MLKSWNRCAIPYILTIRTFSAIVPTTWWVTKRRTVMPVRLAAVVPAGIGGRVAPVPHAGVEAAGARLLLLLERLDGVRRRTAKVRGRVVSLFIHIARCKRRSKSEIYLQHIRVTLNAGLTCACFALAYTRSSLPLEQEVRRTQRIYSSHKMVKM